MLQGRSVVLVAATLVSVGFLTGGWGCASRQVTSGSGDQSMTAREKGAPETVRQEPIATLPAPPAGGDMREPDIQASLAQPAAAAPGNSSAQSRGSALPAAAAASTRTPAAAPGLSGLADIFFDFDQYAVRRDAQAVLDSNARWIRNEPDKSFLIEGHCDERGTLAYNLVLGEKRAKAAKRYLEDLGVPASRLLTTSYGEVKPFCTEHNEGCWKHNRRAHFVVQ